LLVDEEKLQVYKTDGKAVEQPIPCSGVRAASFSPRSNFIITFQRPSKSEDGVFEPNLCVWRVSDGACILHLRQKSLDKDHWPSLQFTADERHVVHQVTNTLHIYDVSDTAAGPVIKFPVRGISSFSLSPVATMDDPVTMKAMVYVPESKGTPAHLALHQIKSLRQGEEPAPIARKAFYRANSVRFLWNCSGDAVLIITAADVDATNQSYYGEQKLFFFSGDGSSEMLVPMAKDGPIHDVQWSPKGDFFVAVAGFMPAKSTLFNAKCVPKFDLGSGPYNMIRWNPFGRFFVLAGFGNLPGDLSFYDKKADSKCKPMGSCRANNGVSLQWSPCGRYVLAATTAPRLRVDNGVQIFKYTGALVGEVKFPVLYEAVWKPEKEGMFQDRPQTPRNNDQESKESRPIQQPLKSKGYVPPHLRSQGITRAPKASFSLARDQQDTGGKISHGSLSAASRKGKPSNLPPGAETAAPLSKSAAKNAKRRAKKKQDASE